MHHFPERFISYPSYMSITILSCSQSIEDG